MIKILTDIIITNVCNVNLHYLCWKIWKVLMLEVNFCVLSWIHTTLIWKARQDSTRFNQYVFSVSSCNYSESTCGEWNLVGFWMRIKELVSHRLTAHYLLFFINSWINQLSSEADCALHSCWVNPTSVSEKKNEISISIKCFLKITKK